MRNVIDARTSIPPLSARASDVHDVSGHVTAGTAVTYVQRVSPLAATFDIYRASRPFECTAGLPASMGTEATVEGWCTQGWYLGWVPRGDIPVHTVPGTHESGRFDVEK